MILFLLHAPQQGLGFIYGASGTFKSFLALDYALHRAYGMKWMGRKTKQAVPVYLAAEGGAAALLRAQVLNVTNNYSWDVASSGAFQYRPRRNATVALITDF